MNLQNLFILWQIMLWQSIAIADTSQDTPQLIYHPISFQPDTADHRQAAPLTKGSHLKIFLPTLANVYLSHAINDALLVPKNNAQGWDYGLATSHRKLNDLSYEFTLRKDVLFQDGTPFNADSVVENMEYFTYKPYQFSKFHETFSHVEKIDDYTVRFHLSQKYGMFFNDLIWLQFYTKPYLEKYGWNGKEGCPNMAEPGPFGTGPYILTEGYAESDRVAPKIVLKANLHYWNKEYPKIETITIYTELDEIIAKDMILYEEGKLDLAPVSFNYKIQTILGPYSKLVISPSTHNYMIHFNLYNGHPKLQEKTVRLALNQALHQKNLLYFVYKQEGEMSATLASSQLNGVAKVHQNLLPFSEIQDPYLESQQKHLKEILAGLHLTVLTQNYFLPLWRGIEEQLAKVGVSLEINAVLEEETVLKELTSTSNRKNTKHWDLLMWENGGWFSGHPWSTFKVYQTLNPANRTVHWSTLPVDLTMDGYLEQLFQIPTDEPGYQEIVRKIITHAYDQAYMLFVPTPHQIWAVNKEVIFHPYQQTVLPLWKIAITSLHPSIRNGDYPDNLKQPFEIKREHFK